MNNDVLAILGGRIRSKRRELGWTQEILADRAQLDRSYIGDVERGERNLSFIILCKISFALNCDVAELTKSLPNLS